MPDSIDLAALILREFDIAALERVAPRRYEFLGAPPQFYPRIFPEYKGRPCLTPWEHSHMLAFFLEEAEEFFDSGGEGKLSSGVWQEEGMGDGIQAMSATAMTLHGRQVLVIRQLNEDFAERANILQKARERLLERRTLCNNLEIYKQKSRYDALTSLYNKGTFTEALDAEMAKASATGNELSLLFIDIDDFKQINDTYGHLAGDAVLAAIGGLLRLHLRREDMASRYGGEEFAVLAPRTMSGQALRLAEKLCKRIAEHRLDGLPSVTVSVGCTTYLAGEDSHSFINRADLALYDAKHNGKNMARIR